VSPPRVQLQARSVAPGASERRKHQKLEPAGILNPATGVGLQQNVDNFLSSINYMNNKLGNKKTNIWPMHGYISWDLKEILFQVKDYAIISRIHASKPCSSVVVTKKLWTFSFSTGQVDLCVCFRVKQIFFFWKEGKSFALFHWLRRRIISLQTSEHTLNTKVLLSHHQITHTFTTI
jgi:hypothetical protein